MAISYPNASASAYNEEVLGTTTSAISLGFTPSVGNRLVMAVMVRDNSESGTAVSSVAQTNNTWIQCTDGTTGAAQQFAPSNRCAVEFWSTVVQSGGTGTITVTFSHGVANYVSIAFLEIAGLDSSPFAVITSAYEGAGDTSHSVTAGSSNPQDDMAVLAVLGVDLFDAGGGVTTPSTGYTTVATTNSASYPSFNFARKTVSASETSSASWTGYDSGNQGAAAIIMTLRAAGVGGGSETDVTVANTSSVFTQAAYSTTGSAQALAFTPATGSWLIILASLRAWDSGTAGIAAFTQTNNTWSQVVARQFGSGGTRAQVSIWAAKVNAGGTGAITPQFTAGVTNYLTWQVIEVTGLDASPTDKTQNGTAAASSTSITVTASGANATAKGISVSVVSADDGDSTNLTFSAPTGYTQTGVLQDGTGLYPGYQGIRKVYTTSETSAAAYTGIDGGTNQGLGAVLATFKSSASGAVSELMNKIILSGF